MATHMVFPKFHFMRSKNSPRHVQTQIQLSLRNLTLEFGAGKCEKSLFLELFYSRFWSSSAILGLGLRFWGLKPRGFYVLMKARLRENIPTKVFCFNSKVLIVIGTLVPSYFRPKKLDNSQSEIYSTTPISHLLFWICTCPPDFFFILSDLTSNFQDVKEKMLFF